MRHSMLHLIFICVLFDVHHSGRIIKVKVLSDDEESERDQLRVCDHDCIIERTLREFAVTHK